MRAKVEFGSGKDVEKFTQLVNTVNADVWLRGKDEHGNDWVLSAKSLLCSLVISAKMQHRKHTAHEVDWNTLWCECDEDIYWLIKDYVL